MTSAHQPDSEPFRHGDSHQSGPVTASGTYAGFEPYVDADTMAAFLAVKRKTILDWARKGIIPTHPFGRGKRVVWRFRISEIASHRRPIRSTIADGSPEIARLEKKRG